MKDEKDHAHLMLMSSLSIIVGAVTGLIVDWPWFIAPAISMCGWSVTLMLGSKIPEDVPLNLRDERSFVPNAWDTLGMSMMFFGISHLILRLIRLVFSN